MENIFFVLSCAAVLKILFLKVHGDRYNKNKTMHFEEIGTRDLSKIKISTIFVERTLIVTRYLNFKLLKRDESCSLFQMLKLAFL